VLVLAIVALLVPLGLSLRDRVDSEVRLQARSEAQVVAASASLIVEPPQRVALGRLARQAADATRGRVIIVGPTGVVLADSGGAANVGTSYASATRPEIRDALNGQLVQRRRGSRTLGEDILVTAVPIAARGHVGGAVRVTQSVAAVHRAVQRTWVGLGLIGLLVLVLGLVVGAVLADRLTRPIEALNETARRVAGGDLDARAPISGAAEQRRLAETFNAMTAQVSRMLDAQREFVADASHQLRTPLAGLRLRLEGARADATQPEQQEDLDHALGEVDRLSAIVSELLELSRADAPSRTEERVDLAEVLGRVAGRWTEAAAARDCTLVVDTAGPTVPVACAVADLDRIIDAVVENSIAYAPGTAVRVSARGSVLRVTDGGPGIDEHEAEAVFDRFHRGRAGRSGPPGTGLGLAIARELARRWGGDLELGPADGGGLEIVVHLLAARQV
jgi:signal transduction histidine kinase